MGEGEEKTREQLLRENAELNGRLSELRLLQSEIRKTQATLKESEERFRIIFEYAPDAYYLSDLKGTFIDGNKAAEEMIGYPKEELIGKSFLKLDLLPMSYLSKAAKLLAQNALGRATGPNEFELKRKDGSSLRVEISTFPVKIQDKTVVLGIARDTSRRSQLQEDLRMSHEQLDLIFDNVNDVIIYLDANSNITTVNRRIEDLFGYKPNEVIGHNIFRQGIISQQDSLKVSRIFSGSASETTFPPMELRSHRKDESELTIEAVISVIKRLNNIEGFVIIAREARGQ